MKLVVDEHNSFRILLFLEMRTLEKGTFSKAELARFSFTKDARKLLTWPYKSHLVV